MGVDILSIGFEDKPVDGNIIWFDILVEYFFFPTLECFDLDSTVFDRVFILLPFEVDGDFAVRNFFEDERCWDIVGTDSTSVMRVLVESSWATERLYGAKIINLAKIFFLEDLLSLS